MREGILKQTAELLAKYAFLEARLTIEKVKEQKASLAKGVALLLLSGIFGINGLFILSVTVFFYFAGYADMAVSALWPALGNIAIFALLFFTGLKKVAG